MPSKQSAAPAILLHRWRIQSIADLDCVYLEETLHLLCDRANAERLLQSIRQAEAGKLAEHDIDG